MKTPSDPFTPPPGASYDQWNAAALAESEALVTAARVDTPEQRAAWLAEIAQEAQAAYAEDEALRLELIEIQKRSGEPAYDYSQHFAKATTPAV